MRIELSNRDMEFLETLGKYTYLATPHIKELIFPTVADISMYRSIKRLGPKGLRFIRKVGVRASGLQGGTAPAVWALSHSGFYFIKHPGKYKGGDEVRHALLVADIHVELARRERLGFIKILDDSRLEYSTGSMRADSYLHLGIVESKKRRKFYVEVQRNGRTDVIGPKIAAHWNAFETSIGEGKYPRVAFVVKDDGHKVQIARQIPSDKRDVFSVHMIDEFVDYATRP